MDQVRGSLWTPNGPVDLQEKDVIAVQDPMERVTMARLHEIAHKRHWTIVCQRCDFAITGQNNDTPGAPRSIACRCTEYRFVR